MFESKELIEDNKAVLWLSDWVNCGGIKGTFGGGGGGGRGVVFVEDDKLIAASKTKQNIYIVLNMHTDRLSISTD